MALQKIKIDTGLNKNVSDETLGPYCAILRNVIVEEGGVVVRRPGETEFADSSSALAIHGLFYWDEQNICIAVSDGALYTITEAGTVTALTGDALLPEQPVSFATNGSVLIMANGTRIVKYEAGATSASYIADANAPTDVTAVAFLNQYFIANSASQNAFFHSNLNDVDTWDLADFYTAEASSDRIEALVSASNLLYVIGRRTIELWKVAGDPSFVRMTVMQRGIEARGSLAAFGDDFLFLDDERRIVTKNGEDISEDIAKQLGELSDLMGAYGYIYRYKGVQHYVINFVNEDKTFAYNFRTQTWTEWTEYDTGSGTHKMYRGLTGTYCRKWNKHLIGDKSDGKIYEIDDTQHTAYFQKRLLNITFGTQEAKKIKRLFIKVKSGQGETGALATAPHMLLRYRLDNGQWTNYLQLSLEKEGSEVWQIMIRRIRQHRVLDLEMIVSDDTDFELVDLEADVEILRRR